MDPNHQAESVGDRRDKLGVRPGYSSEVVEDQIVISLDTLKSKGYTLSSVLIPKISEALEKPGGVRFSLNAIHLN